MPRDGSIVFDDLIGKLGTLRVTCSKCDRERYYRVLRLIKQHGAHAKLTDWLAEIKADCPRNRGVDMSDGVRRCARIWHALLSDNGILLPIRDDPAPPHATAQCRDGPAPTRHMLIHGAARQLDYSRR